MSPLLTELAAIRVELEGATQRVDDLYARRTAIFEELRGTDPPTPQRLIAEASGITEVAVIQAIRKRRARVAKESASTGT